MTNKITRLLLLTTCLIGGELISPCLSSFSAPQPLPISIRLPQTALDFSDLDLRDAQNRPIRNVSARSQMESLFVDRLNEMLINNLTPVRRQFLDSLSRTWDGLANWFKRFITEAYSNLKSWWQEKKFRRHLVPFVVLDHARQTHNACTVCGPQTTFFLTLLSHLLSTTRLLL